MISTYPGSVLSDVKLGNSVGYKAQHGVEVGGANRAGGIKNEEEIEELIATLSCPRARANIRPIGVGAGVRASAVVGSALVDICVEHFVFA